MAFVLKQTRNFKHKFKFTWLDGEGTQSADVTATYLLMPRDQLIEKLQSEAAGTINQTEALLNLVFVGLDGLTITNEAGETLTGDDVLVAAKQDQELSDALVNEYRRAIEGNGQKSI